MSLRYPLESHDQVIVHALPYSTRISSTDIPFPLPSLLDFDNSLKRNISYVARVPPHSVYEATPRTSYPDRTQVFFLFSYRRADTTNDQTKRMIYRSQPTTFITNKEGVKRQVNRYGKQNKRQAIKCFLRFSLWSSMRLASGHGLGHLLCI